MEAMHRSALCGTDQTIKDPENFEPDQRMICVQVREHSSGYTVFMTGVAWTRACRAVVHYVIRSTDDCKFFSHQKKCATVSDTIHVSLC